MACERGSPTSTRFSNCVPFTSLFPLIMKIGMILLYIGLKLQKISQQPESVPLTLFRMKLNPHYIIFSDGSNNFQVAIPGYSLCNPLICRNKVVAMHIIKGVVLHPFEKFIIERFYFIPSHVRDLCRMILYLYYLTAYPTEPLILAAFITDICKQLHPETNAQGRLLLYINLIIQLLPEMEMF